MQLGNTKSGYGWAAIALHWISAAGVIWLYFLGENIEHAKEASLPREEISELIRFHSAVGMTFLVFLAARIVSHYAQRQPDKLDQHPYLNMLSRAVMHLFLLMIAVQIITGPLTVWSRPAPIYMFGWFTIPSPFPGRVEWLHEAAETVHAFAPNLFWPLLALHVAGALKHLLLDRNRPGLRMFWVRK